MATTIPETIKDPEVFLAEIEVDIPTTTIIEAATEPTVIDPIAMTPIVGYGTPVQSQISYNQTAQTSQRESTSSKTLARSIQTTIQQKTIGTHLEEGGDTVSTTIVRPTISFSLSIPISIQPY